MASLAVSAQAKTGLKAMLTALDKALESDPLEDREMLVAQNEGGVLAALDAGAIIVERTFQGEQTRLRRAWPSLASRKISANTGKVDWRARLLRVLAGLGER